MDHDSSEPTNKPKPSGEGFLQGMASTSAAIFTVAGEKYTLTSQWSRPSDSWRMNTAISFERFGCTHSDRKSAFIWSSDASANMASPRLHVNQLLIYLSTSDDLPRFTCTRVLPILYGSLLLAGDLDCRRSRCLIGNKICHGIGVEFLEKALACID